MRVTLKVHTPNPEKVLMEAAAECYQTEPKIGVVKGCIKKGHTSVIEHVNYTFQIEEVSRSLSHQLVRHRIASYTQKSQRYCSEKDFEYIIPLSIRIKGEEAVRVFENIMHEINEGYKKLQDIGIKKEDARYVLPNACATSLTATMNLRSLLNFWQLRMDKSAQWEIRELANAMYDLVMETLPSLKETFDELLKKEEV